MEDLAWAVRRAFERREIDEEVLTELYREYNPIPNPRRFIETALEMFPQWCCGVGSVYFRKRLGKGDVVHGLYGDHPHSFVLVGSVVVDITADQFGGPKVYVGPLVEPWKLPMETPR